MHPSTRPRGEARKKALDVNRMYKRASDIWGIPEATLRPNVDVVSEYAFRGGHLGMYDPATHSRIVRRDTPDELRTTAELHEDFHGIEHLLIPYPQYRRSVRASKSPMFGASIIIGRAFGAYPKAMQEHHRGEALARLVGGGSHTAAENVRRGVVSSIIGASAAKLSLKHAATEIPAVASWAPSPLLTPDYIASTLIFAKGMGRAVEMATMSKLMKTLFQRYGEDGVLFYLAKPPKTSTAVRTMKWLRDAERRGYLERGAGLTDRGIEVLKTVRTRKGILKRLSNMEKRRSREGSWWNRHEE